MPNKKLTIIIPCFNSYLAVSNLLGKIYSVVKCQTKFLEILIIDDFSNKPNLNLRDSLSKRFVDVYFLDNEHKRGVGGARNTGIFRSQGEYLYFADSDDLFDIKGIIDTLFSIVNYKKKFDLIFAQNGISSLSNDETTLPINNKIIIKELDKGEIEETIVNFCNSPRSYSFYPHCWNKFYRKSIILNNKIVFNTELNQLEDVEFVGNCLLNTRHIALINNNLYTHCLGNDHRLSKSLFFPKNIVDIVRLRLAPTRLIIEKSSRYGLNAKKIISRAVGNHCALFFVRALNFSLKEELDKNLFRSIRATLKSYSFKNAIKEYIPNNGEDLVIKYLIIFKIDLSVLILYWKYKILIGRIFS